MTQMNLLTKQKQTHRLRKQAYGYQRGKWGPEGINQETGINIHMLQLLLLLLSHFSRVHSVQPHSRMPRPWDSPGKNTGVGCHFILQCIKVKVKSLSHVQPSATSWTPMDCSLPASSVHGIFQARVLQWVAIAFSNIYTLLIHKIDNQQGPTVQHRKLNSIFYNNLHGKRI